jgi:DNA end-binding protein Ku
MRTGRGRAPDSHTDMAARAIGTGTISFGLVSIPVKFYSAASSHQLSFHMLHSTCGTRVRMHYFCPHDEEVVPRRDLVRGFEHARDQLVQFTEDELKRLESERSDRLDIVEFVPEGSVDFTVVEDTRYVGPARGGDRAYKLLADAMERMGRIAVGRYGARGREQLVLLRPYKGGLVLQQVYYPDEVHPFEDVEIPRSVPFRDAETALADRLVEQLSVDRFRPEKYHDGYRERLLTAVEQKVAGKELALPAGEPPGRVVDLFEALNQSLSERPPGGAAEHADAEEPSPAPPVSGVGPAPDVKADETAGREEHEPRPLRKAGRRAGQDRTGTGG